MPASPSQNGTVRRPEDAVQNFQTLLPVHDVRRAAHGLEVAQQVKTNAGQTGPRCFQTVGLDGERQVLGFHNAVVSAGKLLLQDGGVLGADVVKIIPLRCDLKTFCVLHRVNKKIYIENARFQCQLALMKYHDFMIFCCAIHLSVLY